MLHVITAISTDPERPITDDTTAFLRSKLMALGFTPEPPQWLRPDTAVDIFFDGSKPTPSESDFVSDQTTKIDIAIQPAANRRKRLLIADMDSTMITCECIDELADVIGIKDRVSEITERAMNGEIDFAAALTERVALLKGIAERELLEVYERRIRLTPGARTLVMTMKKHGAVSALVSGGFTFFAGRVAAASGFDLFRANRLEINKGQLAGTVHRPIVDSDTKLQTLKQLCHVFGLASESVLAVGDGANDLPMIQNAGMGVAFHAKPKVFQVAAFRVSHSDLTSLLYLQGIRHENFSDA